MASEKKPLRVYLCDGRNDNRGLRNGDYDEKRDWFFQNVRLMKALTQKGYDVNYSWGMNQHGQKFGGAIMPEMMVMMLTWFAPSCLMAEVTWRRRLTTFSSIWRIMPASRK